MIFDIGPPLPGAYRLSGGGLGTYLGDLQSDGAAVGTPVQHERTLLNSWGKVGHPAHRAPLVTQHTGGTKQVYSHHDIMILR